MWSREETEVLYSNIFTRRAVRRFSPLENPNEILEWADKLFLIGSKTETAFKLLDSTQVKGMGAKAPHYLAIYSKPEERAVLNAAFMGQQLALMMSSRGIGNCWMGMPSPSLKEADGLPFVIVLAFGKPEEKALRDRVGEFKRKSLAEISDIKDANELLEAVRLAPSAMNRQPWYLSGDRANIRLNLKAPGFMMQKALKTMNLVDMGIALCHLWLAGVHEGVFDRIERESDSVALAGYRYIMTVKMKGKG